VTPEQAEKLDLARSVGTLSLVLRNQVDDNKLLTGGATKQTLLGGPLPPPVPLPEAAPVRVKYVAHAKPQRDCIGVLSGVTGSQECF
jgi:pilus assembly protein CpaB